MSKSETIPQTKMSNQPTAYDLACAIHREHRIPAFPVLLTRGEDGRWQKKPLVRWGRIERTTTPEEVVGWGRSNAFGVPMGDRSGLFALDIDDYKPGTDVWAWLEKHSLPQTRTHRTASGGTHLIFRMPEGLSFGNASPAVEGLDVRGTGGYIVWADEAGRYQVVDDTPPADMPQSLIDELVAVNEGKGRIVRDADVPVFDLLSVDQTAVVDRLAAMLADPLKHRLFCQRWRGIAGGMKDTSASAMDMSIAGLLARAGFTYQEIVFVLLYQFEAGKAHRDGATQAVERECCRAAWRAVSDRDAAKRAFAKAAAARKSIA